MQFFSLLFFFSYTVFHGQSYKADIFYGHFYDIEKIDNSKSIDYFEVTGNVKKIKSKEISYVTYKKSDKYNPYLYDSITNGNWSNGAVLKFNRNHQLLAEYWLQENDSVQLRKKHLYNDRNLEIENESYYDNGKFVYSEKLLYAQNLLTEKWIKSSHQTDYFLKERYTYNSNKQLIKEENLNNNREVSFRPQCKGGYFDTDYIYYYYYDENNNINKSESYSFEYKANFKGPPDEEYFTLKNKITYDYFNGKKSGETRIYLDNPLYGKTTIKYAYDNNSNLISEEQITQNRKQYQYFKRYYHVDNTLNLIETGYSNKVDSKYYFKNGIISKFETLNNNGIAEYRNYDEKGVLIEQSRDNKVYNYKFEYDSKGNWIKQSTFRNNILIKEKFRTIEYYD